MKFTLEQTDFSKICQNPEIPLWYISQDTNERTAQYHLWQSEPSRFRTLLETRFVNL